MKQKIQDIVIINKHISISCRKFLSATASSYISLIVLKPPEQNQYQQK